MRSDLISARQLASGLAHQTGFLKLPGVVDSKSLTFSALCEVYPGERPPAATIDMPAIGGCGQSGIYTRIRRHANSGEQSIPSLGEEPSERFLTIEELRL